MWPSAVILIVAIFAGILYWQATINEGRIRRLTAEIEQLSTDNSILESQNKRLLSLNELLTKANERLNLLQREAKVAVTDKMHSIYTNNRIGPGSRDFDVCWFELEGLLYAASLGIEPLEGVPKWKTVDIVPSEVDRILNGEHLGILSDTDIRYVAMEFKPSVPFANRTAISLALITERGKTTTQVYVQEESGDWFVANSRLRARFMEAYIEDGHPDTGD